MVIVTIALPPTQFYATSMPSRRLPGANSCSSRLRSRGIAPRRACRDPVGSDGKFYPNVIRRAVAHVTAETALTGRYTRPVNIADSPAVFRVVHSDRSEP